MRENRTYGSEGGAAETNRPSLPLSARDACDRLLSTQRKDCDERFRAPTDA